MFYIAITKADLQTPGREKGGEVLGLKTKADYKAKKGGGRAAETQAKAEKMIEYYGGLDNITVINNCASRLRFEVKDRSLVNDDGFRSLGYQVNGKGKAFQVIVGGEVEPIAKAIKNAKNGK